MKKRMFSKFTNILHQAVEALAPQLSLLEEFTLHWKQVTAYFIDNKGDKIPIEQTSLPSHLDQMVVLLQEEENSEEKGSMGPCMEYLLQHKLMETLYSLGRTDHPPGMKQVVLTVFTKMLSRLKQPLLPHINVHRAVHRLVRACGEVQAGPAEIEEIQFLCTVCSKIKDDPYLVNFFIEVPKNLTSTNAQSLSSPSENPANGATVCVVPKQEFSLMLSLLNLSRSADSRVAVKACEGLMLCVSLPEESAAKTIINDTQFCQELSQRLVEAYLKLPSYVNPSDLEFVEAKWGLDVVTDVEDQQSFLGKRQLISFLSWLDYCDQLIAVANPIVAKSLAKSIRQLFLDVIMEPSLLQTSESGAILATAYLTRCLRTISSHALLSEFSRFILGDERKPEIITEESHRVRQRLIERCNHLSEEVCLVTLKLFETLLLKDDEHVIHNLLLRNLLGRGYYSDIEESEDKGLDERTSASKAVETNENLPNGIDKRNSENQNNETSNEILETGSDSKHTGSESAETGSDSKYTGSESAETGSDTKHTQIESAETGSDTKQIESKLTDTGSEMKETGNKTEETISITPKMKESHLVNGAEQSSLTSSVSSTVSSPTTSPRRSRPEVHKIVNSFFSLLPEELKSSYQTADSGYDMYLRDAHKQFKDVTDMCRVWAWPEMAVTDGDYKTDGFFEGAFLKMVFDKLSHILDQSYAMNLQLTSVVSKLALIPHPNLHEYLLDPFLPVTDGTKTLFTVFRKVSNEIKTKLLNDPELSHRLVIARKHLMGLLPNIHRLDGQSQLEAIIVLEEFCKELSAIAFVKHHAAVTKP